MRAAPPKDESEERLLLCNLQAAFWLGSESDPPNKGWFFYLLQRNKALENVFGGHSTPQQFIVFIFIKSLNVVLGIQLQEHLGHM